MMLCGHRTAPIRRRTGLEAGTHVQMHWFRSNLRLGSRMALLALAGQAVLAFGHVQPSTPAPAPPPSAPVIGSGEALLNGDAPSHNPDGPRDADCPICA